MTDNEVMDLSLCAYKLKMHMEPKKWVDKWLTAQNHFKTNWKKHSDC
jgi:hypothetical protein